MVLRTIWRDLIVSQKEFLKRNFCISVLWHCNTFYKIALLMALTFFYKALFLEKPTKQNIIVDCVGVILLIRILQLNNIPFKTKLYKQKGEFKLTGKRVQD